MTLAQTMTQAALRRLLEQFDQLGREEVALQSAAARLTAIAAEQAGLVTEAQHVLSRYNALHGTSFTLAQARVALGL